MHGVVRNKPDTVGEVVRNKPDTVGEVSAKQATRCSTRPTSEVSPVRPLRRSTDKTINSAAEGSTPIAS